MGKKSRLKTERADAVSPMAGQIPTSRWAGFLVACLGVGFILTSLIHLGTLSDYKHYQYLFQDNAAAYIPFRYFVSCSARLFGLVVGFGLCFRKEWFRKAALYLTWGTIAVAYWKHPYLGFLRHIRLQSEQLKAQGAAFSPEGVIQYVQALGVTWVTESTFAWLCVAAAILAEVFMALAVIFILTRPSVKPVFR